MLPGNLYYFERQHIKQPDGVLESRRLLPALLLLFIGSGCAALIYEIVWLQLLQLVIGLTTVSLGVLLGAYMGGMCLGSYLLPRLVSARRHPLRVYAVLELGIGVIGIAILFGMPWVSQIYTAVGGGGFGGIVVRCVVAGVCLVPPTLLMGATLPAMSRWVEDDAARRFLARLFLRRQHRRRGFRLPAGRVLPVAGCMTWPSRPMSPPASMPRSRRWR